MSSTFQKIDDNHVYYNIEIPSYQDPNAGVKVAQFIDNRADAVLEKPREYHASVIRASITGLAIPLFVFKTLRNPINGAYSPDNNFYGFTLRDLNTNTDFQRFVQFSPQYTYWPSTFMEHYYIFSFQFMINLMNNALLASFNALKLANPGIACNNAPYFIYDNVTQMINFYCESSYIGNIGVYFNQASYRFFENFSVIYNNFNTVNGKDIQLNIVNNKNNCHCECPIYLNVGTTNGNTTITSAGLFTSNLVGANISGPGIPDNTKITVFTNVNTMTISQNATATATATVKIQKCDYLKIVPDYQTTYLWSDIKSIVLTSSLLPVKEEFTPVLNENTGESSQRILTDFEPPFAYGSDIRSIYTYVPTAEYRRIDLKGEVPLNNFDLRVFWKSKAGLLYPVYLIPGSAPITCKILFERKKYIEM